jgi:hypothetical protein
VPLAGNQSVFELLSMQNFIPGKFRREKPLIKDSPVLGVRIYENENKASVPQTSGLIMIGRQHY